MTRFTQEANKHVVPQKEIVEMSLYSLNRKEIKNNGIVSI
ncbi:hypothetical protein SGODD07_01706 [Streptococcus gordonii]|uniref:Uncharacterized protein n=1 Tax=Streptococcus gordonii TaxID=1302 RepID=A0A139N2E2_STRGN|nr:hypothetical protein SGODD07_01706 [Streptococcus gordonii]